MYPDQYTSAATTNFPVARMDKMADVARDASISSAALYEQGYVVDFFVQSIDLIV